MTTHPTLDPHAPADSGPRGPLRDLRARVSGRLHTPEDPDWDLVRTPWRVNVAQSPLAVLDARDTHDVVAALRWAATHEVTVTAQTTGHGALERDGSSTADGALVVRCTGLLDIEVDLDRRSVWVGAGVRAGDLLAALDGSGYTYLAGSNPSPTVVGMTVTGGLSWFGRAFGSGADSIRTVELVDGLGRVRRVGPEEAELFWALRGAGGDFGIVTRLELALHPAPRLHGGRLVWPVERMPEVLEAFRTVTATAPPELTVWFQVLHFPPLPELPEEVRGRSFTAVSFTHLGDAATAEARLAPLAAVPGALVRRSEPLSLPEVGTLAEEPTDPTPGMEFARLLTHLDADVAEALVGQVGTPGRTPLMLLQVRHLGGALRTDGGSAYGPVSDEYLLQAIGVPAVPELVPAIEGAFAALDASVAGASSGRVPLAFLGDDSTDRWWSSVTRARLVAAKAETDPLGIVRSNRPVAG